MRWIVAFALLSAISLVGCVAQWKFVLINEHDSALLVQVGDEEFKIPPGGRAKCLVPYGGGPGSDPPLITVRDEGGTILHSTRADTVLHDERVWRKYPYRYVRVTARGVEAMLEPK